MFKLKRPNTHAQHDRGWEAAVPARQDTDWATQRVRFTPRHTTHGDLITCHDLFDGTTYTQFKADHDRVGCPATREATEHDMMTVPAYFIPTVAHRVRVGGVPQ